MKNFLLSLLLLVSPLLAMAAPDFRVSINIGEPNYYGPIVTDNMPPPQLLSPQPVLIYPVPGAPYQPMYLRVPPGQAANWRFYCGRYNACARPVYFVNDYWYRNVYAPRYYYRAEERHYNPGHERRYERHDRHDRYDRYDRHDRYENRR